MLCWLGLLLLWLLRLGLLLLLLLVLCLPNLLVLLSLCLLTPLRLLAAGCSVLPGPLGPTQASQALGGLPRPHEPLANRSVLSCRPKS